MEAAMSRRLRHPFILMPSCNAWRPRVGLQNWHGWLCCLSPLPSHILAVWASLGGEQLRCKLLHSQKQYQAQPGPPTSPQLLQRRSSYLGLFSLGRGWLRTAGVDGDAGMISWEELRLGLSSVLWLSSSKTNLLIVIRLFLGCSSEPLSPSAGAEPSFSSFLGLLFLRAGDDRDALVGSTRSFWSSFEKIASESCEPHRVLKAAFRVIIPKVVGVFRSCLQIRQHTKISFTTF